LFFCLRPIRMIVTFGFASTARIVCLALGGPDNETVQARFCRRTVRCGSGHSGVWRQRPDIPVCGDLCNWWCGCVARCELLYAPGSQEFLNCSDGCGIPSPSCICP